MQASPQMPLNVGVGSTLKLEISQRLPATRTNVPCVTRQVWPVSDPFRSTIRADLGVAGDWLLPDSWLWMEADRLGTNRPPGPPTADWYPRTHPNRPLQDSRSRRLLRSSTARRCNCSAPGCPPNCILVVGIPMPLQHLQGDTPLLDPAQPNHSCGI
jgi:hypothetical protein